MKKLFTAILLFFSLISISQINTNSQWTWVKGDNAIGNISAVYGIKGIAASSNKPGARSQGVSWKDASGDLWLFGGSKNGTNYSDLSNELWKYQPSNNMWTWINGDSLSDAAGVYGTKGVPEPANKPGARVGSVSWTDAFGNLWLFGGCSIEFGELAVMNDLWKYQPSINMWTWISGDNYPNAQGIYGVQGTAALANQPGARADAVSWTDASGNLWLFGGLGWGKLNDLWKYQPSANLWTWVKGDSTFNVAGVYGLRGISAEANKPAARAWSGSWIDAAGNFWIFGGMDNAYLIRNELWKYDPITNRWTWMTGNNGPEALPVYGIKGIADSANTPGGRFHMSATWTDPFGSLWLFGGVGYGIDGDGILNDLWKYDPFANKWAWIKGDSSVGNPGVYGTQGTPAPGNKPGARILTGSWTDAAGNFWLFGGYGLASNGYSVLNDLWKITSAPALPPNADLSNLKISQGIPAPAFASATTNYTTSVVNSVTSLTVTPTVADITSTVSINGIPVTSGTPSNPIALATGNNIITVVVTAQDGTTTKTYIINVTRAPAPGITFSGKVFLQGPYNTGTGTMNNSLNTSMILQLNANTQPYNITGFDYAGTESVSAGFFAAHPGIVDWVLVELRDASLSSTVVARRAIFLKQDGNLVDTDGLNDHINFQGLPTGNYFVAIRHRNHLSILSSVTIDFSSGTGNYDFTTAITKAFAGSVANPSMTTLSTGVYGMYAGNANADLTIRKTGSASVNDYSLLLNVVSSAPAPGPTSVYRKEDFNMDGNIRKTGSAGTNDYSKLLSILGALNIITQPLF